MVTQNPAVKAALDALTARWPSTQSRQELLNEVQTQLRAAGADATNVEGSIDDLLDFLIVRGQARYRLDPVVVEPGSTPLRLDEPIRQMAQLTRADADASTFNVWHETVAALSPVDSHVPPLLDGTRDRDALEDALLALTREGQISFERDGHPCRESRSCGRRWLRTSTRFRSA